MSAPFSTVLFLPLYDYNDDLPQRAFTADVSLRALSGSGTITLKLESLTSAEVVTKKVDLTDKWDQYAIHGVFLNSGGNVMKFSIISAAGDLSDIVAWGANLTENPNPDLNIEVRFPYRVRVDEMVDTLSTSGSRCTASDAGNSSRCSMSPATCQDLANFNFGNEWEKHPQDGLKTVRFCSKDAAMPVPGEKIFPYLEEASFQAQEIYPDKSVTVGDRAQLRFIDDAGNMGNINQDHASLGKLTNTGRPRGTFWRRFLYIYPNYSNPIQAVRVYDVFAPATLDDMQLRGSYVMLDASLNSKGQFTLTVVDRLRLLHKKAPYAISSDNLTRGVVTASQTIITFDRTSELTPLAGTSLRSIVSPEVSNGLYPVVIEIDFDIEASREFLNVTQNDLGFGKLTVQRGRWGTAAKTHADRAKWREVLMCGTENITPSDEPRGKNPINIVLELLARGLGNLLTVDTAALIKERDDWVIGSIINNQNSGIVFKRAGGPVGGPNSGVAVSNDIESYLRSIRQSINLDVWTGEKQTVTGKIFAPPLADVVPPQLDDQKNFLADSVVIEDNQELSRFNRVLLAYKLFTGKDGTNLADYENYIAYVGLDDELPFYYGVPKTKVVLSPWIIANDHVTASALAARLYPRYRKPIRKITAEFEIRDDAIKVGDYLYTTWLEIVDMMGDPILHRFAQILRKERSVKEGKFKLLIYDLGQLDRYFIIAPNDIADSYDLATEAERRYGAMSNKSGRVGSKNDPGYRIW